MKIYNYFKNTAEEKISQEFKLKNIDKTRHYFLEEIEQNDLMSRKHKKLCTTLNYIEHFLILAYTIIRRISIYAFAFLFGVPIGITSSALGLKISAMTAGIKKYKSTIKKKKRKHDKIVSLAKSKLNSIEALISKYLIDSVISHDEFVLINNVLREYNEMREEVKKFKDLIKFIENCSLFIKKCYRIP